MLISQVLMTLDIIRKFPRENLEGLAKKVYEKYGNTPAGRFLVSEDLISSRIEELNCVVEENGRYYFNSKIKPYSKDHVLEVFINGILEAEKNPNTDKV
jgi:hypothetical protein